MIGILTLPDAAPGAELGIRELLHWGPWLTVRLLHTLLYVAGAFLLDQLWRMLLRRARAAALNHDPSKRQDLEARLTP
jgi:hypothetical protein